MNRKLLLLSSLLTILIIPSALLAAEPVDPAQTSQAADTAGCEAGQDLMVQILGAQPADPAAPAPSFTPPQEKTWCGACLDHDCSECGSCGGYVYSCAPRCTPICWCYSC
ncbi:MAG TPA: hypothetical protein VF756_29445 [Thermoanaerobaculia bacterium]